MGSCLLIWQFFAGVGPPATGQTGTGSGAGPPRTIGIKDYQLVSGPIEIEGVTDNASGLAFSRKTRTLFVVLDAPCQLVEIGLDSKVLRTISLEGFEDTEDVVHIGEDLYAVVEEGRATVCQFPITADTKRVDYGAASTVRMHGGSRLGNSGFEGLAFSPAEHRYFIVKEKDPRKILSVEGTEKSKPNAPILLHYKELWDVERDSLGVRDISGIHFDPDTQHLLILSHESCSVVEATLDGKEVSRLSLAAGSAGLKASVPKPEGITMDDRGALYICSEPNLLYVFKLQPKPSGK
jgi:uncharacterized protein YjiK